MDGYNVGRLLWSKTTGDNLIQNLLPDNSTSTLTAMTAGHLANTGAAMGYDGDGLRAWKQNDGGTRTYFLYDGTEPVCALDASGNLLNVATFGAQGLLSQHPSGGVSVFYTFDERGNVAQRTNAAGSLRGSDLYDGWGRTSNSSPSDVWGFGAQWGAYTDLETGLVLMTHRFYDPQAGRFLTRDPIGYKGGVNLYSYTRNNPANWNDPTGFDPYAQGQKFLVHGQNGNYTIDVPFGQDFNRNVRNAQIFLGANSGPDIDFKNMNPLPSTFGPTLAGRRGSYLGNVTSTNTCGDYKDKPEYIDPNKDHKLWHERDLGGNFNYGMIGHALGFNLPYLLLGGDLLHRKNTHWNEPHPADAQQAIIDGYNWYTKHYGQ